VKVSRNLIVGPVVFVFALISGLVPFHAFAVDNAFATCTRFAPDTSAGCGVQGTMVGFSYYSTPGYAWRTSAEIFVNQAAAGTHLDLLYEQGGPGYSVDNLNYFSLARSNNYTKVDCSYHGNTFQVGGYCQSNY